MSPGSRTISILTAKGERAASLRFLDGPAGTQVPRQVMDAVQKYFLEANAIPTRAFLTSRRTNDTIFSGSRRDGGFVQLSPRKWCSARTMTTITLGLARAIGRESKPGDEILLTVLDHDAKLILRWKALEERCCDSHRGHSRIRMHPRS